MLLRQVQARPLQGHHLRALRRRGDAPEGAARAHGPHRPRRSGLAHLVLQGRPEPHRLPARHRASRAREGALLRRVHRHAGRRREAAVRPGRPRGQGRRRERAHLPRPRRGAVRPRRPAQAPARLLRRRQGAQLRRGRRLLGPRSLELGRGERPAHARGDPDARRRRVRRAGQEDLERGPASRARARPSDRHSRRSPARSARDRVGGGSRGPDPGRARAAAGRPRAGDRLQEGRHHEAPEPAAGRAAPGSRAHRRRHRAREGRRPEEPRARTRGRRRAARRRAGGRRSGGGRRSHPARARLRPVPRRGHPQGGPRRHRPVGAEGARDGRGHGGPPRGHPRGRGRRGAPPRADLAPLPGARAEDDRRRRADLPGAEGPLRLAVRVRDLLPWRHGRRGGARPAARPRPRRRVEDAPRHDQDVEGPEAAARDQAPQGRGRVHQVREQARVDDPRGRPGHPARASPDGAARRRPVRHERPQRPLPARDQPEQPPEAPARPGRARDHRQQREADAPGGRRRAVRQRPARSCGDRAGQPPAQVALRHAQGQAGSLPPEPARQARGLLGPLGDRRRAEPEAPPVRSAEADGARALQAVHHEPARRAQGRPEHQGGEEDGRVDDPGGLGRPRGGHRGAPGPPEPGADAPPPRDPGVRAGARRGQGDPGAPARLPRLQRRLRRRPDGGPPSALGGGAGRGPRAHALGEQHPLAGKRPAARDADPGHGARRLLPHLLGARSRLARGGRRSRRS